MLPPCLISGIPQCRARSSVYGQLERLYWLEFPYGFTPMYPYDPTVPGAAKLKSLTLLRP